MFGKSSGRIHGSLRCPLSVLCGCLDHSGSLLAHLKVHVDAKTRESKAADGVLKHLRIEGPAVEAKVGRDVAP